MKTTFVLFATLLLPIISVAQFGSSNIDVMRVELAQLSRFSMGGFYSPEASYRFLGIRKGEDQSTMKSIIATRNENETFKYGHTAGIRFSYLLSRELAIESGINYSTFGEQSKRITLTETNGQTSSVIGTFQYKNTYHFISIPIDLNYVFGSKRLRYIVTSGISVGYDVGQTNTTRIEYADGGTSTSSSSGFGTPNSFYKIVLNAQLSAGLHFQVNRQLSLRMAPVFRINATSLTNAPIQGHYFNSGIDTGIMWRFEH